MQRNWASYQNVTNVVGTLISSGKCTLHELETVYGLEDAYDMLEVVIVDSYNQALANQE